MSIDLNPINQAESEALLMQHFGQGRYAECLGLLNRLITAYPLEAKYFHSLGQVHEKRGAMDLAQVAYRRQQQLLQIADNTKTSPSVSRINALWMRKAGAEEVFGLAGYTFAGLKSFNREGSLLRGATSTCGGAFIRMCADAAQLDAFQYETEILQALSAFGCISAPLLIEAGMRPGADLGAFTDGDVAYQILSFTRADRGGFGYPDLLLALLEQKAAGVYNNLLTLQNSRFDSIERVFRLSDFSQAIQLPEAITELSAPDYIRWCQEREQARVAAGGAASFLLSSARGQEWVWEGLQLKAQAAQLFAKQIQVRLPEPSIQSIETTHLHFSGSIDWVQPRAALDAFTFDGGERVLDVGCGMGAGSRYLTSRGCEVCGIDADLQQIIAARMASNIESMANDFRHHDLDYDDLEGMWDTVLLFSVFHHFKYTDAVATRVTQICRQRIFIECGVKERGYKWIGRWYSPRMAWDFENESSLRQALDQWFVGFRLVGEGLETTFGRKIYHLVREETGDASIEN